MAVIDCSWKSVICGLHVYKAIWTPDIGEILVNECQQERGNSEDLYAVRVTHTILFSKYHLNTSSFCSLVQLFSKTQPFHLLYFT